MGPRADRRQRVRPHDRAEAGQRRRSGRDLVADLGRVALGPLGGVGRGRPRHPRSDAPTTTIAPATTTGTFPATTTETIPAETDETVPADTEPTKGDGALCSSDGIITSVVTFDDTREAPVDIYWVDAACNQSFYATVQPGESLDQDTYVGAVWQIRLADNTVIKEDQVTDTAETWETPTT